MQAIPKLKGFKSLHAKAAVVYTDNLNTLSGDVDNFVLAENSLIENPYAKVKIILRGELTSKIKLKTQFASKTAIKAIEKAGGKFEKVAVPQRAKKSDK
jgi:large subunit ribosomal protein L15